MIIDLKSLKPNPYRDFTIDPIDSAVVESLKTSIKEDGFWGGVTARRNNGHLEIAAGHHRIEAAISAGIKSADVFIGTFDDHAMIRVYATENATQRGNTGTAQAGTVASAIKFLAKGVLTGTSPEFGRRSVDTIRGQIGSDKGIGQESVLQFLDGIPGINKSTVTQQLVNLKSSGDYARIIKEVQQEIEEGNKERLKALAAAERRQVELEQERVEAEQRQQILERQRKEAATRAREAKESADKKRAAEAEHKVKLEQERAAADAKLAAKRQQEQAEELKKFDALRKTRDTAERAVKASGAQEKTFDFEGVTKYINTAHQIDVFRGCVTGLGIKPYLPVSEQAALARRLVAFAKENNAELSGAFIREHIAAMVLTAKTTERQFSREDKQALLNEDLKRKAEQYQDDFSRNVRGMCASGQRLLALVKEWPKGKPMPISGEFKDALRLATTIINSLNQKL